MVDVGPVPMRGSDNSACLANLNKWMSFVPAEETAGGGTKFGIIIPTSLRPKTGAEIVQLGKELVQGFDGPNAPIVSGIYESVNGEKKLAGYSITLPNAIKGESSTTILMNRIKSQATRILLAVCDDNSPKQAEAPRSKPPVRHQPTKAIAKPPEAQVATKTIIPRVVF